MLTEIARLTGLLMRWPCSIKVIRQVQAERARLAREEERKARRLRGQIRRRLMSADLQTLARLNHDLDQEGF